MGPTREGLIRSGLILMGVGGAITIGSYALASGSGGGTYVVTTGAFVFGLIRVFRGLALAPTPGATPSFEDPRWAPYAGRQLAGKSCIECKENVVVDAEECKTCGAVLHVDRCSKLH